MDNSEEIERIELKIRKELNPLTLDKLEGMKPGIFDFGTYIDKSEDLYVSWVAIRGLIHDWAIYSKRHIPGKAPNNEYIAAYGNKIKSDNLIKDLVPCTDEAFDMYRF